MPAQPTLVRTLASADGSEIIIGLSLINDYIYIGRSWATNIEVYSASTFSLQRRLAVPGLDLPNDMCGCPAFKCLYISDYGSDVHRVEVAKQGSSQAKWPVGDRPTSLSVSPDTNNLLVIFQNSQRVIYTTTPTVVLVIV